MKGYCGVHGIYPMGERPVGPMRHSVFNAPAPALECFGASNAPGRVINGGRCPPYVLPAICRVGIAHHLK